MRNEVLCCINNLQKFDYGETLQKLVGEGNEVKLERCQGYCVGCKQQPAFIINGKWHSEESIEMLKDKLKKD